MIKKNLNLKTYLMLLGISIGFATNVNAQQSSITSTSLKSSGLASVNRTKVYYEVYGEGKPIVLLNVSLMTIGMN